jgi:hypothetical protein
LTYHLKHALVGSAKRQKNHHQSDSINRYNQKYPPEKTMTIPRDHKVALGRTDDGRWAVISETAPFFYFEASQRDDAIALANKALSFYFGVEGALTHSAKSERAKPTLSRVRRRERLNLDDCVAA